MSGSRCDVSWVVRFRRRGPVNSGGLLRRRAPGREVPMGAHHDEAGPMSVADLAALARLFQQHRARLLAMLRRRIDPRLAARIDAEGVLNGAVVAAHRKWRKFEASRMSPYGWVRGIARDCLIAAGGRGNSESRRPDKEIPWPDRSSEQMAIGLIGSLTSPSEALARGELQERVRQALDALRPADREILWMRHFD